MLNVRVRQKKFGNWSWFDHGQMFRQSWDITQDVYFYYGGTQMKVEGVPKTRRAYRMLEKLADNAVANCDSNAEVEAKVFLTDNQIRILFADEGGEEE